MAYESSSQSGTTNKRSRRRLAATAVEVACLAPVVLLLVFGLFELTRLMWIQHAVTNAAREGCRKAVVASTISKEQVDAEVRKYLRGTIAAYANAEKVRVSVKPENIGTLVSNQPVTTTVSVNYSDVSWFPQWIAGDVHIFGRANMERD